MAPMQYEFGKMFWMGEDKNGNMSPENIEEMRKEDEERIRLSVEKLLESQENFLGRGLTAEVHFLEKDSKLCYKIIRKVDVMARPDSVNNLPPHYREIYDKKKAIEEKNRTLPPSKQESVAMPWHQDLFSEATLLSRARKIDPNGPVKIPRPDARIEIHGKEEGEGYEIRDDMEILLMETMDAVSVDDLIRRQEALPAGFDSGRFCKQADAFIQAMHDNNLYHRDLHAGNVMIERETGNPVFIDFGRGTVSAAEDAYAEDVRPGDRIQFISDETMFRDKVKGPLNQYVSYQNLTESAK